MQRTQGAAKRTFARAGLICLIMVLVLLSAGVSGWVCWQQATIRANEAAEEELQEYISQNGASRSLTYQRLTDSWTRTLEEVYGDVIFFGDSITAAGMWKEYFPYITPVNLGVVGDNIDCLLLRMPQVEMLMCDKCFVLIGVNDLIQQSTVENTLIKYETLAQKLSEMSEANGTRVYLQSVLPMREGETVYSVTNQSIRELNAGIQALAEQYGMTYIDIHSLMADENGMLESGYSFDGLHLSENGYQVWQEALIPYLDE